MCDAATTLLHLSSLAAASKAAALSSGAAPLEEQLQSVEQAQELSWLLCDTLGSGQALMERHGRFLQVGRRVGKFKEGGASAFLFLPADNTGNAVACSVGTVCKPHVMQSRNPPHRPACRSFAASWHAWSRCASSRLMAPPPAARQLLEVRLRAPTMQRSCMLR